MALQNPISIVRYAAMLVASVAVVNAAVAHRIHKLNAKEKKFDSEETGIHLTLKSADIPEIKTINHHIHTVPVHHFARHGLCRHEEGKQYFYKAIKSKLCQIKDLFVASLVEDLCRHRGTFLDDWVSELFDIDGDGMVTHFEKRFYEFNT